jgi:hypothetical protein
MNQLPLPSAAYEAAVALYNKIRRCPDGDPGDLRDVFGQLPGHVETHVLDLPDGSTWAATFVAVLDDSTDAPEHEQLQLVVHSGEGINVYVYEPQCFELAAKRDEDAEYDCGIMLSSDPSRMDEMDAYGLWTQLGTRDLVEFKPR